MSTAVIPTSFACPSPIAGLRAALKVVANLSGRGALRLPAAIATTPMEVGARDGERFVAHACGQGPALLLVHGLGGSRRDWDRLSRQLAARHRVYTWDARGHGVRPGTGAPTLATLADDLASVVERLSGERPLVVGHSMGALTVLEYLRRHGEQAVAGVCLIDQSPRIVNDVSWRCGLFGTLTQAQHESLVARLKRDFAGAVFDALASRLPPPLQAAARCRGWLERFLRRVIASVRHDALVSLLESIGSCDFRPALAALSVPTLVVLGARSHHYGRVPLADYYASALRRGTVTTYAAAAHSPHRETPSILARDLSVFAARCLEDAGS